MTQRSQVPKFGNWESEENVPYTAYFDNARKGKNGMKMNPNDPQEKPDVSSNNTAPVRAPPFQQEAESSAQKEPEAVRSKHEQYMSQEDPDTIGQTATIDLSLQHCGDLRSGSSKSESEPAKGPEALRTKHERLNREGDQRRPTDSPLRHDTVGRRVTVDSPLHRHGSASISDTSKRATRQSVGSDRSNEQSPLHPQQQARVGNKSSGVSSPSWERKGSSEGSHGPTPFTPGRSRLRSVTRGDETPDNGPAVPKFGDWDESDPASAEGYTQLFNRVREERQSAGKVLVMETDTNTDGQKQYRKDNSKGCLCFPWGRK